MELYINKTRNELIVICNAKKIKNYSNKIREDIQKNLNLVKNIKLFNVLHYFFVFSFYGIDHIYI